MKVYTCFLLFRIFVNSNEPLRIKDEVARNHSFLNCNIMDIMWNSTPGVDQTNRMTPHDSNLRAAISHDTNLQSPTEPTPIGPSLTERLPEANSQNPKKTQQKISKKQLKNNSFTHQPRQGISVLEISKRRNPGSKAKASQYPVRWSRQPALHRIKRSHTLTTRTRKKMSPNLLLTDGMAVRSEDTTSDGAEEVLSMREIPELAQQLWYAYRMEVESNQTATSSVTTAGQFFKQTTVAQSYFQMIGTLKEGYMMVFLIELTRLVAAKEGQTVRDVVKHADRIIYRFYQKGKLRWFGTPLIDVTSELARWLKVSKIGVIQNYAADLHHTLSQRHQKLSVEVNTILEYADMLYEDDEGRLLFDALQEFAAYPNISLTGYWLCNSLIHNFLRPYRRLKDTEQRQELIDSVNLQLKTYKRPRTSLRSGDVRPADGPPDGNPPSRHTRTKPRRHTSRSPRERKEGRKRLQRSHKKRRAKKRHQIHRHKPGFRQRHQKHNPGNKTQRPRVQSRFKIKKKNSKRI